MVVVTPSHQFPTGVVLGAERRRQLTAWAQGSGALIVEDDYDAEFRYDREPVGLLQGLAPERVAAVGTVSKSLVPGLRLGWIVCPLKLVDLVAEEKQLADRGCPWPEQLALAALLESGGSTGTSGGCAASTARGARCSSKRWPSMRRR